MNHRNFFRAALAISLFLVLAVAGQTLAGSPVHVRGYVRTDGTYVAPHYRSAPDGNFQNNWSTKGNVNPYTGAAGTKVTPPAVRSSYRPYYGAHAPSYSAPAYVPYRSNR